MRLVFIHYHLNRGGVTSVIRSHLQSLAAVVEEFAVEGVTIAYGGRADDWSSEFEQTLPFPVEHLVVPSLEYDQLQNTQLKLAQRVDEQFSQLETGLKKSCTPDSTVLHVHNHALGKNAALPQTISRFANNGWRALLHVHDFAEDLRPQNYAHLLTEYGGTDSLWEQLYPQASQIHYAALNSGDLAKLITSKNERRVHLLPNPVDAVKASHENSISADNKQAARKKLRHTYGVDTTTPYVLYPVRGIRRKNLGELLLWAALFKDCVFSITLEPKNEVERRSHDRWKELSESLSLPVIFGSGKELTLDENYVAADAVISTSVAEGFGLVFLEASLRNRPLFGRDLPGVTLDFSENGMQFPGLGSLCVPAHAFDVDALRRAYRDLNHQLRIDYGLQSVSESDKSVELNNPDATVDCQNWFNFGELDTTQQCVVISKAATDEGLRSEISSYPANQNIGLVRETLFQDDRTLISAAMENRTVIRKHYSFSAIGRKMGSIYAALLNSEVESVSLEQAMGQSLLSQFTHASNLVPIRVEP